MFCCFSVFSGEHTEGLECLLNDRVNALELWGTGCPSEALAFHFWKVFFPLCPQKSKS